MNTLKRFLRLTAPALVMGAAVITTLPSTVFAAKVEDCKTIILDSSVCEAGNGKTPILNMIAVFTNFLAIGVGIAVVGGIIWGALLYTTSNGDAAKTKQGISVIVNAVIGLLLFIFAYAIINALVPGGLI